MPTANNIAANEASLPETTVLPFATGCFFCLRTAFTLVLVRIFGAEPRLGAVVSLGTGFFLLALVLVDRLSSERNRDHRLVSSPACWWVLLYLTFSGLSLLWGEAASLPASLAYWCGTACDVAILLLLLQGDERHHVALSLMKGFVLGACVIALAAWFMPAQYDLRLGDEDYLNANTIANLCAFGFFFALCLRRCGAGAWRAAMVFLSLTLLRSISKSAIAAFAISGVVLLIYDRATSRKVKLALMFTSMVVVFLFWGLFEAYYDVYTTTGNQALTLTGRTGIWAYVVESLPEHPWIGHGFDSMWGTVPAFGTFQARHAENEILQQLYAYGTAGLVLLAGAYGSFYVAARQLTNHPTGLIMRSLLVYVLVRGIAEAEPFDLLLPLWAILLLSSFMDALHGPSIAGATDEAPSPPVRQPLPAWPVPRAAQPQWK